MEIKEGSIYNLKGILYLVLLKDIAENDNMYWCTLVNENLVNESGLENALVNAIDFALVRPNENWKYVSQLSDEEYREALENCISKIVDKGLPVKTRNGR